MAALRQLSTHIVPPRSNVWEVRLNTHVKSLTLNPYMSLLNLKLWTHIWSTNINFRPPPLTLDFLVRLGLNFHPMGELQGVDWAGDNFFLSRTETWVSLCGVWGKGSRRRERNLFRNVRIYQLFPYIPHINFWTRSNAATGCLCGGRKCCGVQHYVWLLWLASSLSWRRIKLMLGGRQWCHLAGWRSTSAVVLTTRSVEGASGVDRTSTRATVIRARVTDAARWSPWWRPVMMRMAGEWCVGRVTQAGVEHCSLLIQSPWLINVTMTPALDVVMTTTVSWLHGWALTDLYLHVPALDSLIICTPSFIKTPPPT